jgi:ABC-2 type transport system ATP-binding protein
MDAPPLQVHEVTKIFHPPVPPWRRWLGHSERAVVALRGLSLRLEPGEIFGLVGRNGQGKTTLIKSIAALIDPTKGWVRVFGWNTNDHSETVRGHVGLVSADERSFYGRLTGLQNLMFFSRLYDMSDRRARRRIGELVEQFGFEDMIHRRYHELSSGNKQRLALMRALLNDPPLLLLDEPTRSLDPMAADVLRGQIRALAAMGVGKTVLITSHNLEEIEDLCPRVGVLWQGELRLCGSLAELKQRYCQHERIVLQVREWNGLTGLDLLREAIPDLHWESQSPDSARVAFTRSIGDFSMDAVIRQILEQGGRLIECDSERGGLREIMAAAESSE